MSLITGAPASVHGISGNYYLNEKGEAVVMTGPELLGSPTVLATFAKRRRRGRFDHRQGQIAQTTGQRFRPDTGQCEFFV
jgi:predicted AlkP superfamily pyrophosphatase or phosphodiesterase